MLLKALEEEKQYNLKRGTIKVFSRDPFWTGSLKNDLKWTDLLQACKKIQVMYEFVFSFNNPKHWKYIHPIKNVIL